MSSSTDPFVPSDEPSTATSTSTSSAIDTGSLLTPPRPLSQTIGRIVLAIMAVLVVVFALANRQRVTFKWLFGRTEVIEQGGEYISGGVPLILLLLGAFLLGIFIGWGVTRRSSRVRTYRASQS